VWWEPDPTLSTNSNNPSADSPIATETSSPGQLGLRFGEWGLETPRFSVGTGSRNALDREARLALVQPWQPLVLVDNAELRIDPGIGRIPWEAVADAVGDDLYALEPPPGRWWNRSVPSVRRLARGTLFSRRGRRGDHRTSGHPQQAPAYR